MAVGNHYNLASFFRPLMQPATLASIMVIGDSMTAEDAQKGNAPNGLWESWEPPIPTESKVSHWLGRASLSNRSGNNTQHGEAQTTSPIAGGTATTITPTAAVSGANRPNLFGPGTGAPAANGVGGTANYSIQEYLDLTWTAGTRTGSGGSPVSFYNSNFRQNQQGVTVPWGITALGPSSMVNRTQQASARLIWRAHASSPASKVEVIGTRRATSSGGTTFGTPVGSASIPDFTANAGRASSIVVDCGTGAGEPGVLCRSTGANTGAESLFLVGTGHFARPTSSTWYTAGWYLSSVGTAGMTSVDIASLLGCSDNRSGQILTPVCDATLSRDIYGLLGAYGTLSAPNFVILRVGQNLNVGTANPGALYTESTTDMTIYKQNMRLLIARVIANSTALNGTAPYILLQGMIRTSTTDATTILINTALRELAVEYGCAFWDGYARTKDQPLYWYTSAENQSSGGDNTHESPQGARWVQRACFEDGMRALSLDAGSWGGEARPAASSTTTSRRTYRNR